MRMNIRTAIRFGVAAVFSAWVSLASAGPDEMRLGMIGLDTLHSTEFARLINDPEIPAMRGARVVAAYPYGSTRLKANAERIPEYTREIKDYGVRIVDSLDALIASVDGVMLMTNDGTLRLEQVMPVLEAGKPVFVDKPVAADLVDVIRVYRYAGIRGVPVFSASALRYLEKAQAVRHGNAVGEVLGAEAYSPAPLEPAHTDLFWYGMHGVETLYTLMGRGCVRVRRLTGEHHDMVIGEWADGRIGVFRGDRAGRQFYGGTAYGTQGVMPVGPFDGYRALAEEIVEFFKTGRSPVDGLETQEIYTFMQAADASQRNGGEWVTLENVYDQAFKRAFSVSPDPPPAKRGGQPTMNQKVYRVQKLDGAGLDVNGKGDSPAWKQATPLRDFVYPWNDPSPPETVFRALWDDSRFYFLFEVKDDSIIIDRAEMTQDLQVGNSDRVELFFKQDEAMKEYYYSLEMDAEARVLMFRARYYRQYEWGWQWPAGALTVKSSLTDDGYIVEGSIGLKAMADLGVLKNGELQTGVFRANYMRGESGSEVKWISWVSPRTENPDFHVPSAFGVFRLVE